MSWHRNEGAVVHYFEVKEHKNFSTLDSLCGKYTLGIPGSTPLSEDTTGKRCGKCKSLAS